MKARAALLEPDALVLTALRMHKQRHERDVEDERQDQRELQHVAAREHEQHRNAEHSHSDREAVAPALLVRDAVATRRERHRREHEQRVEAQEVEDGVDVQQHRRDEERLRLELVDELPVVHEPILAARPAGLGTAESRVRNWPQAASMSTPRLRRIVVFTPKRRTRSANARSRGGGDARPGKPAVGLSGITFTWAPPAPGQRARSRPRASACSGRSLTPAMAAYSKLTRRPCAPATSAAASSTSSIG